MIADGWDKRWQKSSWKQKEGSAGEFKQTAGKWYGECGGPGLCNGGITRHGVAGASLAAAGGRACCGLCCAPRFAARAARPGHADGNADNHIGRRQPHQPPGSQLRTALPSC
jgi:hypothetical protein